MPEFVRPARVIVVEGGSARDVLDGVAAVVCPIAGGVLLYLLVAEWWLLIAGFAVATATLSGGVIWVMHRRMVRYWPNRVAVSQRAAESLPGPRPRPAIAPQRVLSGRVIARPTGQLAAPAARPRRTDHRARR